MCTNLINQYTYFQEVFLPLLYEQISGRKRMIYLVDKRFEEKEIWNIKKMHIIECRLWFKYVLIIPKSFQPAWLLSFFAFTSTLKSLQIKIPSCSSKQRYFTYNLVRYIPK